LQFDGNLDDNGDSEKREVGITFEQPMGSVDLTFINKSDLSYALTFEHKCIEN
jgi:hypothetical protein